MTSIEDRKAQLEARLEELNDGLQRTDEEVAQQTDFEVTSQASEPDNQDVYEDLGEYRIKEIRMIRAALDRVAQGGYGTCTRCGNSISQERLDVLPATPLCSDCAAAS